MTFLPCCLDSVHWFCHPAVSRVTYKRLGIPSCKNSSFHKVAVAIIETLLAKDIPYALVIVRCAIISCDFSQQLKALILILH